MPKNDIVVALQAQLSSITNLLQTLMINQVNAGNGSLVNAVNQIAAISYVGCGEPHTFDMCP